jgi:ATP-dependent DNA helicase RecQ
MKSPLKILQEYWKFSSFREPQEEIINQTLSKQNSIVLLPTGGGKSLCYQIPALLSKGVCIVVSPLIALIQDQVNSLNEKGIKAIALTSQLSKEDTIIAFDNLQFGNYKFLYVSPEKLQSAFIKDKIKQLQVSIIAIDEAHCISEWGHDFRPSYLKLNELLEIHQNATVIALTATATTIVLNDIKKQLQIDSFKLFKKSFHRKNLSYQIIETENIYDELLLQLSKINEPSIIYVGTRKATKETHQFLTRHQLKSSIYHGGLTVLEKKEALNKWLTEKTPIMVATNAFGMGIDKPNVRLVLHLYPPTSIENYVQEAGRAGRDGKPSTSIIISNKSLLNAANERFKKNLTSVKFVKEVYKLLNQHFRIALGELPEQPFKFSLSEFCYKYQLNIPKTYNAIKVLEKNEVLILDENISKKSTLKIKVSNQHLLNYTFQNKLGSDLIKLILRNYGGVFEFDTPINEYFLSKNLHTSKTEIIETLKQLEKRDLLFYNFENASTKLWFLVVREDDYTINRISKNIKVQLQNKINKKEKIHKYLTNTKTCRNIQLLNYFGETDSEKCKNCDVCLSQDKNPINQKDIFEHIIEVLSHQSLSPYQLLEKLPYTKEEVLKSLKILVENNKISINSQNQFKLNN